METKAKITKIVWPVFSEEEQALIHKIYKTNWSRLTNEFDFLFRNTGDIRWSRGLKVLNIVYWNRGQELIEDRKLYDDLIDNITTFMVRIEEGSADYKAADKLWADLQEVKKGCEGLDW